VSGGGAASAGFSSGRAARRLARMKTNSAEATAVELKALMLAEPKLTLAVAESLTAGQVQARVASVSGASGYFLGGVTAYTLTQKVKLLGVDRRHAKAVNCVSARVAEEMALGACGLFGADVGVATTGYAEASPADGVDGADGVVGGGAAREREEERVLAATRARGVSGRIAE
jgi:PncC family amidohydrolase